MQPRIVLLAGGFLTLAAGVAAGLARMGWPLPAPLAMQAGWHAELVLGGFFGTVISLERAVALGARPAYLAPLLAAAGGLAPLSGAPHAAGLAMQTVASAVLVWASWRLQRRQDALHARVVTAAALAWLVGNLLRLAWPGTEAALPWWIGFLVFTIAGERLELSRLLPRGPGATRAFVAIALAAALAAAAIGMAPEGGWRVLGAVLVTLAAWLLRYDVARRTIRTTRLARYVAVALLCGYFWLAAGGLLLAAGARSGLLRDAALHALLLGFVFSMVLGHAPLILPAVTGARLPWYAGFYLPLALLQATVALRVGADLAQDAAWRSAAGAANAAALALFVLTVALGLLRGRAPLR